MVEEGALPESTHALSLSTPTSFSSALGLFLVHGEKKTKGRFNAEYVFIRLATDADSSGEITSNVFIGTLLEFTVSVLGKAPNCNNMMASFS